MSFDLKKLIVDVFHPEADEVILVLVDEPLESKDDHPLWLQRRQMAQKWHETFEILSKEIGFSTLPLLSYPATCKHNYDLDLSTGSPISLNEAFEKASLVVALTEYSATATLAKLTDKKKDFRAASMPLAEKRMEQTALSADYKEIARRCQVLVECLEDAQSCELAFSTGHKMFFDLRYNEVRFEDGQLPRNKKGLRVVNLPSGEVSKVPYEGEKYGDPSKTEGQIPVMYEQEIIVHDVKKNRIVNTFGDGNQALIWHEFFSLDPARCNIAEFGIGCNPRAIVTGNLLEDEKSGFHWSYGRSDFLGGITYPHNFKKPAYVVHTPVIYAVESPIQIDSLVLNYEGNLSKMIIKEKSFIIF
ncbi:MAG: hypothetical protein ABIA04_02450 [Pseudomonadota bacterium]